MNAIAADIDVIQFLMAIASDWVPAIHWMTEVHAGL
jgi:hypothetical protein